MHNFSDLFDKVLYMFWTVPLSIVRSIPVCIHAVWDNGIDYIKKSQQQQQQQQKQQKP